MLRMRESIASPVCCHSWSALSCWLLLLLICWSLIILQLIIARAQRGSRVSHQRSDLESESPTADYCLRCNFLLPRRPCLSPIWSIPQSHQGFNPSLGLADFACFFDSKGVERETKLKWERFHFEHRWNPLWWSQWQVCMNLCWHICGCLLL